MAKAPMMPIWTDALIADTTHLTAEQFGCYVLILLATWRNNGVALADDDSKMSRICRVSVTRFRRKIRPFLCSFFSINDQFWHQQRLEKEWNRLESLKSESDEKPRKKLRATRARTDPRPRPLTQTHIESLTSAGTVAARACVPAGGAAHAHDTVPETWKPIGIVLGQPAIPPPEPSEENRRVEQRQQHMRYLKFRGANGDLDLYLAAQLSDDIAAADRMFELTDARMRADVWDDRQEGGSCAGSTTPSATAAPCPCGA